MDYKVLDNRKPNDEVGDDMLVFSEDGSRIVNYRESWDADDLAHTTTATTLNIFKIDGGKLELSWSLTVTGHFIWGSARANRRYLFYVTAKEDEDHEMEGEDYPTMLAFIIEIGDPSPLET